METSHSFPPAETPLTNDKKGGVTMNTTDTIYLTKKGIKEIKKQISRLERNRQDAHAELRELDKTDAHEERLARVEKLAQIEVIESEIADKKVILENARLYPRKRDALKVAIGSVVELIDMNGRIIHYTIVDSIEADPSDGRISFRSPLGQNLLGKQIQDMIEWGNGLRTNQLRLVGIK